MDNARFSHDLTNESRSHGKSPSRYTSVGGFLFIPSPNFTEPITEGRSRAGEA